MKKLVLLGVATTILMVSQSSCRQPIASTNSRLPSERPGKGITHAEKEAAREDDHLQKLLTPNPSEQPAD